MREVTKTYTVYTFDELAPDIQAKVLDKNRYMNVDFEWWQWAFEDAAEIGVKITEFDLGYRGMIKGEFLLDAEQVASNIVKEYGDSSDCFNHARHFLSNLTELGLNYGRDEQADIYNEKKTDLEEQFLHDILSHYHEMLIKESDWLTSNECLKECFITNNFEFTASGEIE